MLSLEETTLKQHDCCDISNTKEKILEAMTASSDATVTKDTTANQKAVTRHVTIGESTIVFLTPDITPDTPDSFNFHTFNYSIDHLSCPQNTTNFRVNKQTNIVTVPRVSLPWRVPEKADGKQEQYLQHEYHNNFYYRSTSYNHGDIPVTLDLEADPSNDLQSPDQDGLGVLLDSVTGWPLKRSESLESRENPFLPGGELSREAEDLLSRATIIRDNFYLDEDEKRALREQQQQLQPIQKSSLKHAQTKDNPHGHVRGTNSKSPSPQVVFEEPFPKQTSSSPLAAAPSTTADNVDSSQAHHCENGKVADSATSSDNVKLVIPEDEGQKALPGGDGSHSWPGGDLQVHGSDKKPRNKCCSVM